jgi:hypothetical protein
MIERRFPLGNRRFLPAYAKKQKNNDPDGPSDDKEITLDDSANHSDRQGLFL